MTSVYHLPLTRDGAKNFLEAGSSFEEPIEAASMFAALTHLKHRQGHTQIERLLREVFPLFRSNSEEGHQQLLSMRPDVNGVSIEDFVTNLLTTEVVLVSSAIIQERRWLAPDGNYSFDFQSSCNAAREEYEVTFHLPNDAGEEEELGDEFDADVAAAKGPRRALRLSGTRDQAVVARIVASAPDERVAVDAYAGTGKTFLVHALREHLPGGFTYVAPQAHQGFAFRSHAAAGSALRFITLNRLAEQLALRHVRESGAGVAPRIGRSEYSFEEQAQMAGVTSIGDASVATVMQKLYRGIGSWSASEDSAISEAHFRRAGIYDREEMPFYLESARRLWRAMFAKAPRKGQAFDIWDAQIAKWLELNGASFSGLKGTLLVDEAHDLPPAWHRIFDGYQGGCILLGDPHQRLRGKGFRSERAQSTRMTTSLRTGVQAADMIENTLRLSAERSMSDFVSAGDHITHLRTYSSIDQLPEDGLRLFGSEWAMLAVALRRAAANAPFNFLPASRFSLEKNVRNARAIFEGRFLVSGISVDGQRSWEGLADRLHKQGLSATCGCSSVASMSQSWPSFLPLRLRRSALPLRWA